MSHQFFPVAQKHFTVTVALVKNTKADWEPAYACTSTCSTRLWYIDLSHGLL